jgi:hypothetical protein
MTAILLAMMDVHLDAKLKLDILVLASLLFEHRLVVMGLKRTLKHVMMEIHWMVMAAVTLVLLKAGILELVEADLLLMFE